jgi:hypothetical protein
MQAHGDMEPFRFAPSPTSGNSSILNMETIHQIDFSVELCLSLT